MGSRRRGNDAAAGPAKAAEALMLARTCGGLRAPVSGTGALKLLARAYPLLMESKADRL